MAETYLALDIGGSKYLTAIIDREGHILAKKGGPWQVKSADEVLTILLKDARALLEETGEKPVACGATIPGLADPDQGLWVEASFSGIRDFPICRMLEDALGIPAYCDNDGQAYALAEMTFGCCRDVKDFLFVNVSNGIGGAIVSGGKLVGGSRNFAGEWGHCHLVDGGRHCHCGQDGCLEMYAAGPGIAKNYREITGRDDESADCKEIARRAREGEKEALELFDMEGEYLGRVIAAAVNLLNPERIVIGGGVSLAFDLFESSLVKTVRKYTFEKANPRIDIRPTPLGYEAGLYSAAAIAIIKTEEKQ